ncbi:MAG: hypothetical protein HYX73_00225 [Acidobacteria bacterium]|nr:hypothetical protein [Acidobacteriota bacterium]
MLREPPLSGDLSVQEKILLARGGSLSTEEPRLDVLIALANDSNDEVSQAAQETLDRLPDMDCARLLATPLLDSSVTQYFLEPLHFRPGLLPVLLDHPASPPEAVAALAAKADTELISQFLSHLDKLKTPVLIALKENPAYLDWQKRAQASNAARFRNLAIDPIQEKGRVDGQKQLAELISIAESADPEASRGASETLIGLSDEECLDLLAALTLEQPIARFFLTPSNVRPALLPLLLGHPDTPQDAIVTLAGSAGPEIVPILLDQLDLLKTPALVALKANPTYLLWQKEPPTQGYVLEVDLLDLLIQEMETEKPPTVEELEAAFSDAEVTAGDRDEQQKGGLVNKIARMKVAQRVKLALLGTREERSLLIRDASRVVFRAVLGSPKLTDTEVEGFATLKNVHQEVLRLVSMNRRFMKSYTVLKNIANNPRTPIDVSLPLLNRLLPNDLRALSGSREVPETLRKMAQKLIRSRAP